MRLDEQYRPAQLSDVIGQSAVSQKIDLLQSRQWGGRAYYISGRSGTGKTTIAKIIANNGAEKAYITELVGRLLTPVRLIQIKNDWIYYPMADKQGYALIVNESHGLSRPVIELFLDILENLPANVVVIFTTTTEGNDLFEEKIDSSPFASRCINLKLASRGLCEPLAARAKEIATAEGLDGKPIEAYIKLLRRTQNNMRMALSEIESGAMLPTNNHGQ